MKGARTSSGRGSAALRKAKVALACILAASLLGSVKAEAGVAMAPGCGALSCTTVCTALHSTVGLVPYWFVDPVGIAPLGVPRSIVMPRWFRHVCVGHLWIAPTP